MFERLARFIPYRAAAGGGSDLPPAAASPTGTGAPRLTPWAVREDQDGFEARRRYPTEEIEGKPSAHRGRETPNQVVLQA